MNFYWLLGSDTQLYYSLLESYIAYLQLHFPATLMIAGRLKYISPIVSITLIRYRFATTLLRSNMKFLCPKFLFYDGNTAMCEYEKGE
jgi:hypothetical protein